MRPVLVLTFLGILFASAAQAQQEPTAGIAMGYPTSIGLLWHLSDRVAIRPDFNVLTSSSESESSTVAADAWTYGVGLSGLAYVARVDNLRTYVSPRFTYTHTSNTASVSTLASSGSKTEVNGYQVAGSFGAQYALHRRFSVYGEAGMAYAWSDSTFKSSVSVPGVSSAGKTTVHSWGMRTALGVVLYFH